MLSKISVVGAMLAAANAWSLNERGYTQPRGVYGQPDNDYYGAYSRSYNTYNDAYSFPWVRRSTFRPRQVAAQNANPVDKFWETFEKIDNEIIKATCELDFLGYSASTGRVEFQQQPGDLVQMFGDFTGLSPGLHGFKIHEFGDLEQGCGATGDVFNPFDAPQGDAHQDITQRRVGDIEQV